LLAGLVREVEANWANLVRDVRLFEIGTVFIRADPGRAPREELHVAGVMTGGRAPAHWSDPPGTRDLDPWDLKGLFERAVSLAVPGGRVQVDSAGWTAVRPDGRVAGSARPLSADAPAWAAPVLGFELELDPAPRSA